MSFDVLAQSLRRELRLMGEAWDRLTEEASGAADRLAETANVQRSLRQLKSAGKTKEVRRAVSDAPALALNGRVTIRVNVEGGE